LSLLKSSYQASQGKGPVNNPDSPVKNGTNRKLESTNHDTNSGNKKGNRHKGQKVLSEIRHAIYSNVLFIITICSIIVLLSTVILDEFVLCPEAR
jgi:hypothetical protein